ncbi:hypothetical protein [Glutamicibacter nicotianae]|uniref:hypothetical protein n=1 Tax=Glutamicibacter nicotianae TaxID=37929 RepID=UPI00167F8764|nr:hypothetical protein [Glutamicibacter nicotianae]
MAKPLISISDLRKCVNDDCKMPIRPERSTIEEYPGTCARGAGGECGTCYQKKRRRNPKPKQELVIADPKALANKRNLDAFLKQIHATRQRVERRQKIRMVTR